ncbi:hypothetical protein [Leptospira borgpetersenii]|uniref:hypothetical protein n=1 Tax=Leptospira borgpetersenii TaxID=174 RepID=UPI002153A642|nr:hypothetical protein [Leptospira borgpetersenii]UVA64597.1 hypothetical protein LH336_02460 [Leptospira borgpetersenii]
MLFSNELNYWVIKKNAKKYLLLRMGRHIRTRTVNRSILIEFSSIITYRKNYMRQAIMNRNVNINQFTLYLIV